MTLQLLELPASSSVAAAGILPFSVRSPMADSRACRLVESADGLFAASSHPALRKISCETVHGALVLRGRVPTYYLKQLAYVIAKSVADAVQVVDCLEVCAEENAG